MPADHYYEQANPDLLYRIPVTARSVLEVGCGSGALGREFKAINPSCTYIGIELMPEPADKARTVLDHVIEGNINELKLDALPGDTAEVDCLVFGDVLEHLIEPEQVLVQLLPFLKDHGDVLICVPNVQHWSVIANLLTGTWPQEEQGIFDRTHLRWFTKNSLVELINKLGLHVQSITPRIFQPEKAAQFSRALAPGLANLNINAEEFLNGSAPLQYVIKASKGTVSRIQISGLMLSPQAGMNEVRMIQPLRSVSSLAGVSVELSSNTLPLGSATREEPRIMIWQRQLLTYEKSLSQLRKAINAGFVLVSEFDDDPDHWPAIEANKNLNFTAMHAVQTSTDVLGKKLAAINPNIAVFENCLERLPTLAPNKWEGIGTAKRIKLFFGALNRQASWEEWMEPLNQILQKNPEKWEVEVIHDKMFFNALQTKYKQFTPTCNYDTYMQVLTNCHISLLPLEKTKFNAMKSDLKFVESAGSQVATIASPTVYENTIEPHKTGIICREGKDLIEILDELGSNPEKAQEIAVKARNWCKLHRLQHLQTQRRLKWYQTLWQQREKLTKELLTRVPELAN